MQTTGYTQSEIERQYSSFFIRRFYRLGLFFDFLGQDRPARQFAVDALGLGEGQRALSVACGDGLDLPLFSAAVSHRGQVIGLDYTSAMLQGSRSTARAHNLSSVSLARGDAATLPFPDGTFDAVICSLGLTVIPGWETVIREMWRVLRPGGKGAVLDGATLMGKLEMLRWLERWVAHIARADTSRDIEGAFSRVFRDVTRRQFCFGVLYVLVGTR
ncbi:MAG: methyltransferase domain-containing protein [Chloroflexi bacterium]|nr:methyltransferase domain-containing protein [Chloroflexota bacterium]